MHPGPSRTRSAQTTPRSTEPHARQNHTRLPASLPLFPRPLPPPPPSRASALASARMDHVLMALLPAWAASARPHPRPLRLRPPPDARPQRRLRPCDPLAGHRTSSQEVRAEQDGRSTSVTMCGSSRSASRACSSTSAKLTESRACGLESSSVAASPARARITDPLLGEFRSVPCYEWSFPLHVAGHPKFHDALSPRKVRANAMGNTRFSTRLWLFLTNPRLQQSSEGMQR